MLQVTFKPFQAIDMTWKHTISVGRRANLAFEGVSQAKRWVV